MLERRPWILECYFKWIPYESKFTMLNNGIDRPTSVPPMIIARVCSFL